MADDSDKILDENHKHNMDVFTGKKVEVKKTGPVAKNHIPEFKDAIPEKKRPRGRPKGTKKTQLTEPDLSRVWELLGKPYGFNRLLKEVNEDEKLSKLLRFALRNIASLCIHTDASVALGANKLLLQHLNELGDAKEQAFSFTQQFVRPEGKDPEEVAKSEGERLKDVYGEENG